MTNRKNQKRLSPQDKNTKRWRLAVISIIILAVLSLGWFFLIRNETLYNPNKQEIRAQVQSGLDAAKFQSEILYSSLDDLGCDSRNSVGLALYVHCDFLAQKYFRSQGDLGAHLKEADHILVAKGWHRAPYPNQANAYDQVFSNSSNNQLRYEKNDHYLYLSFYRDATWNSYADIAKVLGSETPRPGDDKFVYGVWSKTSYWSCRWDSFLKQPCPAPPGKAD